jgi:acyl-CoA dehydrogenase
MDFGLTPRAQDLQERLLRFMDEHVHPAEPVYAEQHAQAADFHAPIPVMEELKAAAREQGLWNLFLPDEEWGAGLSNQEYAPLAEITGRSALIAPEAINCAAPDTGNMEVLAMFGTPEQQDRWLRPLLDGEIRSAFAMTEPDVASSDATNMALRIEADGDEYVVNGRKWWTTGAMDPRCKIMIVMGVTTPDGPRHGRHAMVLVPRDTPGVEVVRNLTTFGYAEQHGHAEVRFTDVRVPKANLVGQEGGGFAIAQARLGPGRIHHCMRMVGMAERALELMVDRSQARETFGQPLHRHGTVAEWIALSRLEIEQARLLTLKTAWMMDTVGNRAAAREIAGIKVVAARMACDVIDRAIQVWGGAGMSQDTPLGFMYTGARTLRLADGPDEVHLRSIAKFELAARQRMLQSTAGGSDAMAQTAAPTGGGGGGGA